MTNTRQNWRWSAYPVGWALALGLWLCLSVTLAEATHVPPDTTHEDTKMTTNRQTIIQHGAHNAKTIRQRGAHLNLRLEQYGDRNASDLQQDGTDNTATSVQRGDKNTSRIRQQGSGNRATIIQRSPRK